MAKPPKTVEEAIDSIVGQLIEVDPDVAQAEHLADMERVEIDGKRKYYKLREKWSGWIIKWITGLILFNCSLAVAVGLGKLDFLKYEWFITIVTVETFLQIVGMGYVAVKFLFSDTSSAAPK